MNRDPQLSLFQFPHTSLTTALQNAASNGRLFYSIREVAGLLGISGFRVYYLVYYYRLDALVVAGEYRIPFTAVIDYLEDRHAIARQYRDWLAFIDGRTVSGVLPFIADPTGPLPTLPEDLPVSPELAEAILYRPWANLSEGGTEVSEATLIDWYGLPDLQLPHKASVRRWADLIGVYSWALAADTGWSEAQMIEWPEMYDWMISREVANLPVPYRFVTPRKDRSLDISPQLSLGLEDL